jgi:hypothetical protein
MLDVEHVAPYYLVTPLSNLPSKEVPMESVFSGPERRSPRVPANIALRLLLNGDSSRPGQSARAVDLSDRGLRIRTTSALSAGQIIRIDAWGADGRPMPSRVVWVQQTPSGESLAGLEFQEAAPA